MQLLRGGLREPAQAGADPGRAVFVRHQDGAAGLYSQAAGVPVLPAGLRRGRRLDSQGHPVNTWHELIGDPTIGDAILDRVLHNAFKIELKGESLRKKNAKKA